MQVSQLEMLTDLDCKVELLLRAELTYDGMRVAIFDSLL